MLLSFFLVSLGGYLGAVSRFLISSLFNVKVIGTFIINITGSMLLALLYLFYVDEIIGINFWLLLGVGFCGSYTTFSTFSYEVIQFIMKKQYQLASIYVISSIVISLSTVFLILMVFK